MTEPRISLMMLVRNEGKTLRACLDSVLPYVDEAVIGFGGESDDGTEEIAAEELATWGGKAAAFPIEWTDDFAAARNQVLDRVTGDYALWLDGDDLLVGGDKLRSYLGRAPEVNTFYIGYRYGEGEQGETVSYLIRERLIKDPSQWRWTGRIHEILTLAPTEPLVTHFIEDVLVVHQKTDKEKGTRNLDLLYKELHDTEPEPSQRLLMYLGSENARRGNFDEAMRHWDRFISRAEFNEEAYQVAHKMADVLRAQGRNEGAREADLRAIEIKPEWPDAYFGLAHTAYQMGRYVECIEWTKAGQTKPPPLTGLEVNPLDYSYYPLYFLGLSYAQLGDHEMAVGNLIEAAKVKPEPQLMETLEAMRQELGAQEVLQAFLKLYEHLGRNDEWLKARKLFEVAPKVLETHPALQEAWSRTRASTAHVDDPQVMVDFYRSNPGWEPMSEEMLLSKGWAEHPRMKFARTSLCPKPEWVLDMGSSDGFISLPLAREGYTVTGYDLDPRCVDLANERARKWDLDADYKVGSVEDIEPDARYDTALAFEIIEHLVDPGAFLDKLDEHANKVVLTTPYMAWEGGRVAEWQKVEPKGHLRIFDLADIERLLSGRGRVLDLYREPYGQSAWIFASYQPRREYSGTVAFLAPGTLEAWSPRKLRKEGLGGSETALIRLSEELFAKHALSVSVYGSIDEPGYYRGVRYRDAQQFLPEVGVDSVVAWRYPEAADLPLRTEHLILWMHDTDAGDRLTPVRAARFSQIVVLSEWHKSHMLKTYPWLDPDKLVIIGNGVDKDLFTQGKVKRDPKRVIYSSSPDRGLDVILEHIWPKVTEAVPDAELHVYYGWNNFDALQAHYPHLREFRDKIARLMLENKNVVNHGRIPQDQLAGEMRKSSVWLYPTYFSETYCITAVEAQLAGCIPVTNDLAALAETVTGGIVLPPDSKEYAEGVIAVLERPDLYDSAFRRAIAKAAPAQGWDMIAEAWSRMLSLPRDGSPADTDVHGVVLP